MHHLVPVLLASFCLQGVSSLGQQGQYHPLVGPGSLHPLYRGATPLYPLDPPGASKPFFTFAEVNTPYYHYHYYAPVYNSHLDHPPLEISTPESPFRNEVSSYNSFRESTPTGPPKLFYPATPKHPLNPSSRPPFQKECPPPYCHAQSQQQPSIRVPFQNPEPLFRTHPYAPSFRTYQKSPHERFPHFQSQGKPAILPSDLATSSPNIIREDFKEQSLSQNALKETQFGFPTTLKDPFHPDLDTPYQTMNPLFVTESLATPSSSIVKEDIRREVLFKPESSQVRNASHNPYTDNFFSGSETFPLRPDTIQSHVVPHSVTSRDEDKINAKVTYISFPQNSRPQLPPKPTVRSIVLSTELLVEDSDSEKSERSSFNGRTNLDPQDSKKDSSNSTGTHTQKIGPKSHPNEGVKSHTFKRPNVLFDAPGHDSPD